MPIKFRCQYCQQLLGISRSRAGAVVDCPRCGRSLRVPELDGSIRQMPDEKTSIRDDSGLISALAELSVLDDFAEEPSASADPPQSEPQKGPVELPPVEVTEPVDVEISQPQKVVGEEEEEKPVPIRESLEELSSLKSEDGSELGSIRMEDQKAGSPLALIVAGICLIGAGFFVGQIFSSAGTDSETDATSTDDSDAGNTGEGKGDAAEADVRTDADVSGRITWQRGPGQEPDADALILLLPVERIGSVRLHARSIKRAVTHQDFKTVLAGLESVGAYAVRADAEGQFAASPLLGPDVQVVVISRHHQRDEDLEIPRETDKLLAQYFDSTAHICGQLAVRQLTYEPGKPIEVQFGSE